MIPSRSRVGPPLPTALAEALVVVVVWGSSFVLVKAGLRYAGPLTLAGLRYTAAFVILLPFALRRNTRPRSRGVWVRLALIGLCAYTVGNGCLFWGLQYLPSTTSSFLMSLVPLLVLGFGILWLREYPTRVQVIGLAVCLAGCGVFFAPGLRAGEPLGLAVTGLGLAAFAVFGILGREVARDGTAGTLALTAFPLGFGGIALLPLALAVEGAPRMAAPGVWIVLWLALVNTAAAYLLYNHALQTLTALEMNLLLNLSPFATALIALLTLGERLQAVQYVGMGVAIVGVALAQWRRNARPAPPEAV
ncbi:MAG: EamA family transporter [Chloroflexi bacterium]|nr:EamA family transporter [Chloroflexota bacterium]